VSGRVPADTTAIDLQRPAPAGSAGASAAAGLLACGAFAAGLCRWLDRAICGRRAPRISGAHATGIPAAERSNLHPRAGRRATARHHWPSPSPTAELRRPSSSTPWEAPCIQRNGCAALTAADRRQVGCSACLIAEVDGGGGIGVGEPGPACLRQPSSEQRQVQGARRWDWQPPRQRRHRVAAALVITGRSD